MILGVRSPTAIIALLLPLGCGGRLVAAMPDASPPADVARDTAAPQDLSPLDGAPEAASHDAATPDLPVIDAAPADHVIDAASDEPAPTDAAATDSAPDASTFPVDAPAAEALLRRRPSCPDPTEYGCGVARVRGGTFDMGPPEVPAVIQHDIAVSGFVMDRDEVTVRRFRRFFEAGMPRPPAVLRYPGGEVPMRGTIAEPIENPGSTDYSVTWTRQPGMFDEKPVEALTWATAQAFCVWDGGRLPTEAEWDWVAFHLPDGRPLPRQYPFGSGAHTCEDVYIDPCRAFGTTGPMRVGSRRPEGLFHDLAGNVSEWTADAAVTYEDRICWGGVPRRDPVCGARPGRVLRTNQWRGASFNVIRPSTPATRLNADFIDEGPVDDRTSAIGFRCAYAP